MDDQHDLNAYAVQAGLYARRLDVLQVPLRGGKSTALHAAHEYWTGVLEQRRAALVAKLPPAPERAVCDGWGLVTIPSGDGPEHYACHGCRSCRDLTPPQYARDPFARLPQVPTDDELEF